MGQSLRIGRVFGVELRVDSSWFIVFVLIAWSLADHYFPKVHPSWSPITYWWMGILTSLVFFGTVFAHELAHSVAARARGIPVKDITLYIVGGATQMTEKPGKARDELLIAVVGPLTSLTIAGAFAVLWWLSPGFNGQAHALAGWLIQINLILGLSYPIPGFPLDGGRVLRAIVWGATGDPQRATAVAAGAGRIVAFGLIFLGIWQVFAGDWADGLWIAFIGWFLDRAASASGQHDSIQRLLAVHTAREALATGSSGCSPSTGSRKCRGSAGPRRTWPT